MAEFATVLTKTCFFFFLDTQLADTFQIPLQSGETITKCDPWTDLWIVDKNDLCSSLPGPSDPQSVPHASSSPQLTAWRGC